MDRAIIERGGRPFFILIAGLSCSGKTTLARKLKAELAQYELLLLCQDSWFKDLPDIPRGPNGYRNLETTEAFHTEEFRRAVMSLASGAQARVPRYDVSRNIRTGEDTVGSSPLVIVEGLHTVLLLSGVLEHRYSIFVDTPPRLCLERRIRRDTAQFGIPEEKVRSFFSEAVYPFYLPYIEPQRSLADELITT